MTAQIIPFLHPYPANTRLNTGFIVCVGLSIAVMIVVVGFSIGAVL